MTRKTKLLFIFSVLTLASCSTIPKSGDYTPQEHSIHAVYPVQFTGVPKTPNQRLQVNSRGPIRTVNYSCLFGQVSVTFIDNLVSIIPMKDKKAWNEYGYLIQDLTRAPAADGTINIKAYFIIEYVGGDNRNEETGVFNTVRLDFSWNTEKMEDGWMHGTGVASHSAIYMDHKIASIKRDNRTLPILCTTLTAEELTPFVEDILLRTTTPEQKSMIVNKI